MTDRTASDVVSRRAIELDTLAAVLPIERRDELAELLTDQDVETLRHLVNEGMGANSLRALTSDLSYLQAWALAATGSALPWPAPEALLLKFVAHHLWLPEKRETDPNHGMPADVELNLRDGGFLRVTGPHSPSTVRRRLAHWSTLTKWRGLEGAFASPALKSAIRLAVRAAGRPRQRKSRKALTGDVVARLIATCAGGSLRDLRDRAVLMVAFGSGGRRRSEIASLRYDQMALLDPVELDDGTKLPSISIDLGRTKTSNGSREEIVFLTGAPVDALDAWLAAAKIQKGSVFRAIDQWGNISRRAIDAQSINAIVKQRPRAPVWNPATIPLTACARASSWRLRCAMSLFSRRWTSPVIVRCSRQAATIMMHVARPDWPHGHSDRRGDWPWPEGSVSKVPRGELFKVGSEPFDAAAYGLP